MWKSMIVPRLSSAGIPNSRIHVVPPPEVESVKPCPPCMDAVDGPQLKLSWNPRALFKDVKGYPMVFFIGLEDYKEPSDLFDTIKQYGGKTFKLPTEPWVQYILVDSHRPQPQTHYLDPSSLSRFEFEGDVFPDKPYAWTRDRIVRYFCEPDPAGLGGDTAARGRNTSPEPKIKGKVVLDSKWVQACIDAQQVLGAEDDWGGCLIKASYSVQGRTRPSATESLNGFTIQSIRHPATARLVVEPTTTATGSSVVVSAPAPDTATSSGSDGSVPHAVALPRTATSTHSVSASSRPLVTNAQSLQPSVRVPPEVTPSPSRTTSSTPTTSAAGLRRRTMVPPGGSLTRPRSSISTAPSKLTAPRLAKQPSRSAPSAGPSAHRLTSRSPNRSSPPPIQLFEGDGQIQTRTNSPPPLSKAVPSPRRRKVPRETQPNVPVLTPLRVRQDEEARPAIKRRRVTFAETVEVKVIWTAEQKPARTTLRNSFPIEDAPRALRGEVYEPPRRSDIIVKEESDDDVVLVDPPVMSSRHKSPETQRPPRPPTPEPEYDAFNHEEEVMRAFLELQLRLTEDDRIALAFLMAKLYDAGSKVPKRGFFTKLDHEQPGRKKFYCLFKAHERIIVDKLASMRAANRVLLY